MRVRFLIAASLAAFVAAPLAASPADYAAAVAPEGRPGPQVALDEGRKPAEILDFLQVKPDQRVLDFFAGQGYFTRILARAVGPKGEVTAFEPDSFYGDAPSIANWNAISNAQKNVKLSVAPMKDFAAPANSFDSALLNLVYHDLYWASEQYKFPRVEPDAILVQLFKAMKPGGVVAVTDHFGPAGDPRVVVEKLHRIDPETVKADFARAGFTFDGEGDALRIATDDQSKNVFDPAVRGKTDRFMLRFRKPG